jgi:type I restriction enzyme S subunit
MSPDALSVPEPTVLPVGWAWAHLGQLGSWVGGGTPSRSIAAYWTNGSIPWVSPKDMKAAIITDTQDHITQAAVTGSATKYVPVGSVLMVVRSGILRHTFPVAVNADQVTVNQDLRALIPAAGINPRYVAHYLHGIQRQVLDRCSKDGTTVQSIEVSALERVRVPVAPTTEQRRIVARIDELFAEIDEGEAALERARQSLDTWRRALLKAAVTGELTRDWRKANRPAETGADLHARIRAKREASALQRSRSSRQHPRERFKNDSLTALPDGWAWATLGDLSSLITSGSRGWKQYYSDNGSIFIRAQNLKTDQLELDDVAYVELPSTIEGIRTRVSLHDILITITGANVTRSAQVDLDFAEAYVNQHVGLVRLTDPSLSDFVFLVVICPSHGRKQLKAAAYGAGKPGLNLEDLASVMVPLPPLEEQCVIMRRFREAVSEAENALALMESARDEAGTLRQAVLKAAFEGRLVPQDSMGEPASELLARLRESYPGNGVRRRRARSTADLSQPSLPGLMGRSVDPRVEPADDD